MNQPNPPTMIDGAGEDPRADDAVRTLRAVRLRVAQLGQPIPVIKAGLHDDDPRLIVEYLLRADYAEEQDDLDEAERLLRRAVARADALQCRHQQLSPPRLHAELGTFLHQARDDVDGGIREMRVGLDLDGQGDPYLLYWLSAALTEVRGDHEEERESNLRRVLDLECDRERVYYRRALRDFGRILLLRSEYEAAEDLLRRALELDPKDSFALRDLGWVLLLTQRVDEAEVMFRRELDETPDAHAYGDLAWVLVNQGRLDDAERMFHRALEIGSAPTKPGELSAARERYLASLRHDGLVAVARARIAPAS